LAFPSASCLLPSAPVSRSRCYSILSSI
ncbi:hypothetical protein AB1N83_008575, partial [Pleurotus pulmonarius]